MNTHKFNCLTFEEFVGRTKYYVDSIVRFFAKVQSFNVEARILELVNPTKQDNKNLLVAVPSEEFGSFEIDAMYEFVCECHLLEDVVQTSLIRCSDARMLDLDLFLKSEALVMCYHLLGCREEAVLEDKKMRDRLATHMKIILKDKRAWNRPWNDDDDDDDDSGDQKKDGVKDDSVIPGCGIDKNGVEMNTNASGMEAGQLRRAHEGMSESYLNDWVYTGIP